MSGSSTLAKLPNGGERRTSLATTFSPAPGMSTGTKATESQCQLFNFGQQHVTNYYSLVHLSSDKGAGAFDNAHHGSALGTDSYTLPSGTGPGTTGKPGTPTNRKHTRRLLPNLVNNLHLRVESNYAKQVQDTINSDVATAGTKLGNGNDNGKFSCFSDVTGHHGGHIDASSTDAMPSKRASEDVTQLNCRHFFCTPAYSVHRSIAVTHEHVRHVETEEVQRVKELERHSK